MERTIHALPYQNKTKNRILDVATKLFALKGFHSVSMKELASAVGINSASIYFHYDNKEALMEDVLLRFEQGYRNYIDWQFELNSEADSVEEIMDNLFNKEFMEMLDTAGHLGMSIALREQHGFESARNRVFNLVHDYGIKRLQITFDRLVDKGVIPPSDTKMIAILFTYCVLTGNDLRLHELSGRKPPVDCVEIYSNLRTFLTAVLMKGSKL